MDHNIIIMDAKRMEEFVPNLNISPIQNFNNKGYKAQKEMGSVS